MSFPAGQKPKLNRRSGHGLRVLHHRVRLKVFSHKDKNYYIGLTPRVEKLRKGRVEYIARITVDPDTC